MAKKILLDIVLNKGDGDKVLSSLKLTASKLRAELKEASNVFDNLVKTGSTKGLVEAAQNVDRLNIRLKETRKDIQAVNRLLTSVQSSSSLLNPKPAETYGKEIAKLTSIVQKFSNLSTKQQSGLIGDKALSDIQQYKRFLLDVGVSARQLKQIISGLEFKNASSLQGLLGQKEVQTNKLLSVNPSDNAAVTAIQNNISRLNREILIAKQNLGLLNTENTLEKPNQQVLELISKLQRLQSALLNSSGDQTEISNITNEYKKLSLELAKTAAEQRELGIASQTNTTQFATQIGSLNSLELEIRELVSAYKLLSKEQREGLEGDKLIAQINKLTTEANKAASALKAATTVKRDTASLGYINQLEKEIQDLTQQYKGLTKAQLQGTEGRNIVNNIQRLRTESERLNKALTPTRTLLENIKNVFGTTVGATIVFRSFNLLTEGIRSSSQEIVEFDKQLVLLSAILETDRKGISVLEKEAKRLGATTAFTAVQVAELQTELAKLGFEQNSIRDITPAVIDFSIATGSEVPRAAKLAGAALKSFNLDLDETQNILGTLAISTLRSASTFDRLETQLPIVGATASVAGVSIEKLTSLLGVTADRGIDASIAATSLRNIFIELDKRGLSLEQGLSLINKSSNKASTAFDLFGKRGQAVALILSETQDEALSLEKSITGVGASLAELAQKQLTSIEGKLTLLRSAFSGLILSIDDGEGIISNFFKTYVEGTTDLLIVTRQLIDLSKEAIKVGTVEQRILGVATANEQIRLETVKTTQTLINQSTRVEELSDRLISLASNYQLAGSRGRDNAVRIALIGQQFSKLTPEIVNNEKALKDFELSILDVLSKLGITGDKAQALFKELLNIQINVDTAKIEAIPDVLAETNKRISEELRKFDFENFTKEQLDAAIQLGKDFKKQIRDDINFLNLFGDPDDPQTLKTIDALNKALKEVTFVTAELFRRSEGKSLIGLLFDIKDISTLDQAKTALNEYTEALQFIDQRRDPEGAKRIIDVIRQLNEFITEFDISRKKAEKSFPFGSQAQIEQSISKLKQELKELVDIQQRQSKIDIITDQTAKLNKIIKQNETYIEQLKEIRFLNNTPIDDKENQEFVARRIDLELEANKIIAEQTIGNRNLLNEELAQLDREANIKRIQSELELVTSNSVRNRLNQRLARLVNEFNTSRENLIKLRIDVSSETLATPLRNFFIGNIQEELDRGEINYQQFIQKKEQIDRGYEQSVLLSQIRLRESFIAGLQQELDALEIVDDEGRKTFQARLNRILEEQKELDQLRSKLIELGFTDFSLNLTLRADEEQDIINSATKAQNRLLELFLDRKISEVELERELENLKASQAISIAKAELERLQTIDQTLLAEAQLIELKNQLLQAQLKLNEANAEASNIIIKQGRDGKALTQEQTRDLQVLTGLFTTFFTSVGKGENVFKSFGKVAVATLLEIIESQLTAAILAQNTIPFPGNIISTTFTLALIRGAIAGLRSAVLEDGGILDGSLFAEKGVKIKGKKERKGLKVKGNRHSAGGVKFIYKNNIHEYEGGETVINRRSSAAFPELLSAINSYKGYGRKFQDGGSLGAIPQLINPSGSDKSLTVRFSKENLQELADALKDVNSDLVFQLGTKVSDDVAIGLDTENRRKERTLLANELTTA